MLVSKYIQIDFADPSKTASSAIADLSAGVESASFNLRSRYSVQLNAPMLWGDKVVVELKIPEDIAEHFRVGPHLKGIATHLLKNCGGRYDQYLVGKRLLVYTEIPAPEASDNKFAADDDCLQAVARFADLMRRSDDEAKEAIRKIQNILREVYQ